MSHQGLQGYLKRKLNADRVFSRTDGIATEPGDHEVPQEDFNMGPLLTGSVDMEIIKKHVRDYFESLGFSYSDELSDPELAEVFTRRPDNEMSVVISVLPWGNNPVPYCELRVTTNLREAII